MGVSPEAVAGEIGATPTCRTCGTERVAKDALACWNPETGLWELETVFDQEFCHQCEQATTFVWRWTEPIGRAAIRELNDRFRTSGHGNGSVMVSVGVRAEGGAFLLAAVAAVRAFDEFSTDNDPWGEHDFGAVEVEGQKIFWKIDYYDQTLNVHSPNPANDGVTHRVLTIMLPEEY